MEKKSKEQLQQEELENAIIKLKQYEQRSKLYQDLAPNTYYIFNGEKLLGPFHKNTLNNLLEKKKILLFTKVIGKNFKAPIPVVLITYPQSMKKTAMLALKTLQDEKDGTMYNPDPDKLLNVGCLSLGFLVFNPIFVIIAILIRLFSQKTLSTDTSRITVFKNNLKK